MNSFCALADLAPPSSTSSGSVLGVAHQMAARSRYSELRAQEARTQGSPAFVAIGSLQAFRNGVHIIAAARLDHTDELKKEVASCLGEEQQVPSAADLILASYFCWQERCAEYLLGDFAFVIWDSRRRSLLAVRDPLGVKPFHYVRSGSRLWAASEILCLLGHPAVSSELDLVTVGDFLTGNEPTLDRTFFQQIRRLPPGHSLKLTAAGERLERYWNPNPCSEPCSEAETAERFEAVLQQAVGDRLRPFPDVAAVALSGGLDSATVAALACRERTRTGHPRQLIAGSLVFERLSECDERTHLQAILAALEIPSITVEAERFWFLGDPEAYRPGLDTPALSWEGGYRQLLRALSGQGTKILLTGHGADHLLKGSGRIYADRLRRGDTRAVTEVIGHARKHGRDWHFLYKFLAAPLLPPNLEDVLRKVGARPLSPPKVPSWIAPDFARATALQERLHSTWARRREMRSAHQEIRVSLEQADYLRSVEWYDRNAAPFGIEIRHPFLDRRLFDCVLAAPPEHLFRLGVYKPLLRRAMAGILPESIRLRKDKTRLGSFLDYSLREKAVAEVENLLRDPIAESVGLFERGRLCAAFADYRLGSPHVKGQMLWNALALELWLRQHPDSLRPHQAVKELSPRQRPER